LDKKGPRKSTIAIILLSIFLFVAAIYVGVTLTGEESDEGAEPTEAAPITTQAVTGSLVLKTNWGDCDNNGCQCNDSRGCEIYYFRCPGGWVNGICLKNKTLWGTLSNGQRAEYPEILDEPSIQECDYVQIDMDYVGYHNPGEGILGYALFEWTGNPDCEPSAGCGDNWCSAWEKFNNRCEMRLFYTSPDPIPWDCKNDERIEECRSDCTWCGDGKVQLDRGEECDPADPNAPPECGVDCKLPVTVECGDGTVDATEECDYAAEPTGCPIDQECDTSCACNPRPPECGDGTVDATEECDYNAEPPGCPANEECSDTCVCSATAACGDGNLDIGEECDYNADPTGCSAGENCSGTCVCSRPVVCGDGTVDEGEECDNAAEPTGCPGSEECSTECVCHAVPECGDGNLDAGEECEVGIGCSIPSETCDLLSCQCSEIVPPQVECGDGTVDAGEDCDFNANPTGCLVGEECTSGCVCSASVVCGDGTVDATEDCDYMANPTGCAVNEECETDCSCSALIICGDGTVEGAEECDYAAVPSGCDVGEACDDDCTCYVPAACGDGTVDAGEDCDYAAVPTGCAGGEDCANDCTCYVTAACGDGSLDAGEECEVGIACVGEDEACDLSTCQCNYVPPPEKVCEDLSRVSSDTVGINEVEIFDVQVSGSATEAPYSMELVKLRVSSTSNDIPVGEDYNTGSTLVSPTVAPGYSASEDVWTYTFAWKAVGLVDGSYEVEASFDGGATWSDIASCIDTFTFDDAEEIEPAFLIVKVGYSICKTTIGANMSYTITVTNLGPGEGTIEYVKDQLDTRVEDSWVSSMSSTKGVTGSVNSRVITWTGTAAQRTYAQQSSGKFTYILSVPSASLDSFSNDIVNIASTESVEGQADYDLMTVMNCSGVLPRTGTFDKTPWVLAIFALILGITAYRLEVGKQTIQPVILGTKYKILEGLGLESIARSSRKKKIEDRFT